nr:tyrosine-specific transport protein isoform X2 [Ipomoea batatas]
MRKTQFGVWLRIDYWYWHLRDYRAGKCRGMLGKTWLAGLVSTVTMQASFSGQQVQKQEDEQAYEFERLFSNLNQATLKREPGSLSSAIFLVAGTTIGAGILAIPAVTQESGFLASAVTCIGCWIFMVTTGLLIAEVNVKTMCELGSGGVSLVSMAMRTLGNTGVQIACWSYIFIHYALLVAYVARSSDILTSFLGIPLWETATLFSLLLGGLCLFGSQRIIGAVNGALVLGIISSFTALVVVASGDLHWEALLKANFEAAPQSIPIIALSFVYQNVVPVLCTNLEGDLSKVRSAIILGTAIPLALFLVWNGVILGTIGAPETGLDKIVDPLQQLRSANGVGVWNLIHHCLIYFSKVFEEHIGLLSLLYSESFSVPERRFRFKLKILELLMKLKLKLCGLKIIGVALDQLRIYLVLFKQNAITLKEERMGAATSYNDPKSSGIPMENLVSHQPEGKMLLRVHMLLGLRSP